MKKILFIFTFITLTIILTLSINKLNHQTQQPEVIPENIALMIETDIASGEYEKSTLTNWPTDHDFNYELSYCLNDTPINWNEETNNLILNTEGSDKCYIYFNKKLPTLADSILANNGGKNAIEAKTPPDFATKADTNEGMFAMTDDYGISYYFRGAVDNNWLKFANMYWRIVRINGDGSVKLIYTGTTAPTEEQAVVMTGEGTQSGTSAFNEKNDTAEYVGYMYTIGEQRGLSTSSTIKIYLENWYTNNLFAFDHKISDALFCYDRSTYSGIVAGLNYNGNGVGTTSTWYGAAVRLIDKDTRIPLGTGPSLICPHKDDSFTKLDIAKGNGKLAQKIGLLTADEASVAGLLVDATNANINNYLYTDTSGYLGSAYWFTTIVSVFGLNKTAYLGYASNMQKKETPAHPVISLSSTTDFTGNGTWNNPYVVN